MSVIAAKDLSKSYGDFKALDGVSLNVQKGEFFGLFGPNGAGKSTFSKIMTGQLDQDSGIAKVLGISNEDPIGIKSRIGIVPEAEVPPTFLTCQEYLELVCRIRELDNLLWNTCTSIEQERCDNKKRYENSIDISTHIESFFYRCIFNFNI